MRIKIVRECHVNNIKRKVDEVIEVENQGVATALCEGKYAVPVKGAKTETATAN